VTDEAEPESHRGARAQTPNYPLDVTLMCVRRYVAYPVSLRHIEELVAERRIDVDHSTVHRWAIKLLPVLDNTFRNSKRPAGKIWRMDETSTRLKGNWKYLYWTVGKDGNTIDFLLRAHRTKTAAWRYFEKAIAQNNVLCTRDLESTIAVFLFENRVQLGIVHIDAHAQHDYVRCVQDLGFVVCVGTRSCFCDSCLAFGC
jgi:hypothetical protein